MYKYTVAKDYPYAENMYSSLKASVHYKDNPICGPNSPRGFLMSALAELCPALDQLGLKTADDVKKYLDSGDTHWNGVANTIDDVIEAILDRFSAYSKTPASNTSSDDTALRAEVEQFFQYANAYISAKFPNVAGITTFEEMGKFIGWLVESYQNLYATAAQSQDLFASQDEMIKHIAIVENDRDILKLENDKLKAELEALKKTSK